MTRWILSGLHAMLGAERHDGAVEKFIGDAVVGPFGAPHVHDALLSRGYPWTGRVRS
ncbi:MAG: hypothetical protein ABI572_09510 [Actinomycetota bacterium]